MICIYTWMGLFQTIASVDSYNMKSKNVKLYINQSEGVRFFFAFAYTCRFLVHKMME